MKKKKRHLKRKAFSGFSMMTGYYGQEDSVWDAMML